MHITLSIHYLSSKFQFAAKTYKLQAKFVELTIALNAIRTIIIEVNATIVLYALHN